VDQHVTSKDGTRIAYHRDGHGPAVILLGGALDDGSENAPLVAELATHFTVFNYARRGRGASGDTPPYAVEREIEDLEALIAEARGSAHLFGVSSGGMFALEAAAAGLAVDRIALYEVPYDTADDAPQRNQTYRERLGAALAEGRRGDALELFMRLLAPPTKTSREHGTRRTGRAWKRLLTRSPTMPPCTVVHRPPGWRRSHSRRW
jgi:pimeloyl-ACP methyl ester carboxylesterase